MKFAFFCVLVSLKDVCLFREGVAYVYISYNEGGVASK